MKDFVREFVEQQRAHLSESILSDSAEARLLGKFLDQLEEEYDAHQNEVLSIKQAAEESGYTRQAIGMFRRKELISDRRADLPRKPGHGVPKPGPQRIAGTRSVADRVLGRRSA